MGSTFADIAVDPSRSGCSRCYHWPPSSKVIFGEFPQKLIVWTASGLMRLWMAHAIAETKACFGSILQRFLHKILELGAPRVRDQAKHVDAAALNTWTNCRQALSQ